MAKKKWQSKPKHPKLAPPAWHKRVHNVWKIAAFIFGSVLATLGYYHQYGPQLSVTWSGSLNPTDRFSTDFVVKNESLLSVSRIRADCSLKNIELDPPLTPPMKVDGISGVSTENMSKLLSRGESMSIACFMGGMGFRERNLRSGELLVDVSFRYLALSNTIYLTMNKLFKFGGKVGTDGKMQWMPRPLDQGTLQERPLRRD
jgi:hypothetical protein